MKQVPGTLHYYAVHPDDLDKDDSIDRAYPEVDDSIEETWTVTTRSSTANR